MASYDVDLDHIRHIALRLEPIAGRLTKAERQSIHANMRLGCLVSTATAGVVHPGEHQAKAPSIMPKPCEIYPATYAICWILALGYVGHACMWHVASVVATMRPKLCTDTKKIDHSCWTFKAAFPEQATQPQLKYFYATVTTFSHRSW